jgi:dynein heavy chain
MQTQTHTHAYTTYTHIHTQDDAERDLAAAKPALDAALAALNSISPKDITSLKALKNPPDVVKRIFDCVLLLRHW